MLPRRHRDSFITKIIGDILVSLKILRVPIFYNTTMKDSVLELSFLVIMGIIDSGTSGGCIQLS